MTGDNSFFTLRRLHLARFDHLQRFIQPADVGLLKCNGKASDQIEVGVLVTFSSIGVRAFVIMSKRSQHGEGERVLAIGKQTHLVLGDTGAQVTSQFGRRGEDAKQDFEQQFITDLKDLRWCLID